MFPFIFQLIYPKQCCACHEALIFGEEFICLPCLNALPTSHFRQEKSNYLLDLFEGELSIQETFAFAWFSKGSKMQEIMHQIKYKGNKGLARYMGKLLAKAQQHRLLHSKIQALVPVPLHPKRLKKKRLQPSRGNCQRNGSNITNTHYWPVACSRKICRFVGNSRPAE